MTVGIAAALVGVIGTAVTAVVTSSGTTAAVTTAPAGVEAAGLASDEILISDVTFSPTPKGLLTVAVRGTAPLLEEGESIYAIARPRKASAGQWFTSAATHPDDEGSWAATIRLTRVVQGALTVLAVQVDDLNYPDSDEYALEDPATPACANGLCSGESLVPIRQPIRRGLERLGPTAPIVMKASAIFNAIPMALID